MIGSRIGHYEILEHVGQGGMGVVYKARDVRLERVVALKFLPRDLTRDSVARTRFVHEARSASALDHPNICTVYDIGDTDDGQMFIAMAYYPGRTLRDRIEDGPLSVEDALDYALQIASGLSKAHAGGIVHRDVKPANVMITDEGEVKIVDFGLAKAAHQTQVTKEGSTLGTAAYMSPEQARGESVDERTDQFSLGAVIYEMVTGKPAFGGEYSQAIIYSVLNESPAPLRDLNPDVSPELAGVVDRMLMKAPEERFASVGDAAAELMNLLNRARGLEVVGTADHLFRRIRSPRVAIPVALAVVAIAALFAWLSDRHAKARHAEEVLLPRIDALLETSWSDFIEVYALAEEAESHIPDHPRLLEVFAAAALHIDITTDPAGADVYMKPYATPEAEWRHMGVTPIDSVRVPFGIFRWRVEKDGYEPVLAAATTWSISLTGTIRGPQSFHRVLDEVGAIPDGMVRVAGFQAPDGLAVDDFFVGRTEVTNAQFKAFVDAGGYRTAEYWQHSFMDGERTLTREEAMSRFVDRTGRPGPATWSAGDFPENEGAYPVAGVSWYEAAAFASWAGASLPTATHWGRARGEFTPLIQFPQLGGYATFAPFSNFGADGPVETASFPGYTSYGAYDMAGNVREWCWNETSVGRLVRGGAYGDNTYAFTYRGQAPPMDRSEKNGFRLAVYPDVDKVPESLFAPLQPGPGEATVRMEPVSDEIFEIYAEQFAYDDTPLNEDVESTNESGDWIHERISFDAAYGGERMLAHLFLPKNVQPPYQTVVYFPGSASLFQSSSQDIESYYEFPVFLEFIVKNGRAVLYPVYQGTFERQNPRFIPLHTGQDSYAFTEYTSQLVKDVRRSIDYLESRDDIEPGVAFYGMSWGGMIGTIVPAVEDRIRTVILMPTLLLGRGRPEVSQINYIPRITVPTLILGGEYDTISPVERSIRPVYEMLGTPEEHKALKLFPTDHIPPKNDFIRETLDWLDRYLGPVQ